MKQVIIVLVGVLLFGFGVSIPSYAQSEKQRQPNVEIWVPPDFQTAEGPWPLVVFSHGYGGCAVQSVFLTQYLADHGYIVAAPDHKDARPCKRGMGREQMERELSERAFRQPETWSDETYRGRQEDVVFSIDSMMDDPYYKDRIDANKIAVMGHSLGGYTALGLAGAWPSWKDKRIKAVVALSPFANPYIVSETLSNVDVPVMFQGGTRDFGVTPSLKRPVGGGYKQANPPKYYLEFDGADHKAWSMRGDERFRDVINITTLNFLDRYLKDQSVEILPKSHEKQVSVY
jgi:predicted dienelactone hydrolase